MSAATKLSVCIYLKDVSVKHNYINAWHSKRLFILVFFCLCLKISKVVILPSRRGGVVDKCQTIEIIMPELS